MTGGLEIGINRLIVVSNELPVKLYRNINEKGQSSFEFTWDDNSLYAHIRNSFPPSTKEVCYVGLLWAHVESNEQDDIKTALRHKFNCFPVFVPPEVVNGYYNLFCKRYLWPIFHSNQPLVSDPYGGRLNQKAYITINDAFSHKVMEVVKSETDHVWVHDYHLFFLPVFLRQRCHRLRIGFFLHTPFPSLDIFGCMPMRYKILKGMLNSDVIGFQTIDYARHFLGCCSRLSGLDHETKRGYISLDYHGRVIRISIMSTGINVYHMKSLLQQPCTRSMVRKFERRYQGKTVLTGVDDLDRFKGVRLKILALEELLKSNPNLVGDAVLVQILNPARSYGPDEAEVETEIRSISERINREIGSPGYTPVVLIDGPVDIRERVAYYAISKAAIFTPLRDGMNLMPYEYVICRHIGANLNSAGSSMIVVSEFAGCSLSLGAALRVNPWDVRATAVAMNAAISASDHRRQTGHAMHYHHITANDIASWSRRFVEVLETACVAHNRNEWWRTVGSGINFGLVVFRADLKKLDIETVGKAYRRSQNRVIMLDYDGTLPTSIDKRPTEGIIGIIKKLCEDPNNTVFVITGRGKENLGRWLGECEKLGIAAEHGYFISLAADREWKVCCPSNKTEWMRIAEPIMNLYTIGTAGSYIERKETAMVWHHEGADREVGYNQAKALQDHLRSLLANQPVVVSRGRFIVEVKPQGVDKGKVAKNILEGLAGNGRPADFVLCVGDDKSDEDMFLAVDKCVRHHYVRNKGSVFTCTVVQKPTVADYYLDDTAEVETMLETCTRW